MPYKHAVGGSSPSAPTHERPPSARGGHAAMADDVADVTKAGWRPESRGRRPPPGKPPPGRSSRWPPWAGYAVAIGVAVLLVVGLAVRADRRDAGGGATAGPPPAAASGHALGETARTGDLD